MLKKSLYFVTSLFVVFGMLALAGPAFALVAPPHARGRVVAINRRTHVMTVKTAAGTKVKLRFDAIHTRLWHKGIRLALSRLHVGNMVDARFTPGTSAGGPGTAGDVDDDQGQFEVSGTIAAVDTALSTVSIASEDGGSTVVLKVDSTTVITRNCAPATLADLLFGDKVDAKYNSATMIASSITVADDIHNSEVEGSITAVDSTAGTLTISGEGDSSGSESVSATDVTLNVNAGTVIMLDGSPATLSSLLVGMQAEAQYDPSTMNASFIEAETQSQTGH